MRRGHVMRHHLVEHRHIKNGVLKPAVVGLIHVPGAADVPFGDVIVQFWQGRTAVAEVRPPEFELTETELFLCVDSTQTTFKAASDTSIEKMSPLAVCTSIDCWAKAEMIPVF